MAYDTESTFVYSIFTVLLHKLLLVNQWQ